MPDAKPNDAPPGTSRLIPVSGPPPSPSEFSAIHSANRARQLCEQLEAGNILFFAESPFPLSADERDFLLGLRQTNAKFHKNVAYRPLEDRLTGLDQSEPAERVARLRAILRAHSDRVTRFLGELLPPYGGTMRRDFASFRPLEEQGRQLRLRARNDLLHTDAFPTRPTNGRRILRVFTNLNPAASRVWLTSLTFEALAHRYAGSAVLPRPAWTGPASGVLRAMGRGLGIRAARRSPYDRFMLRFHNFLKENREFQETCTKQQWEFPPGAAWIVFTDMVSHAVLAGQFALEQTFLVPHAAMVRPEKAPIAVLEALCGYPLSIPEGSRGTVGAPPRTVKIP